MAMKSLRVSPEKLDKVKRAFERTGLTQNEFASEVDLRTRQPIGNFLAGKPVKHQVFKEICFKLDMDWQEVADLPKDTKSETEQFQDTTSNGSNFVGSEDAIASSLLENELDELVQKVRSLPDYSEKIQHLCGTMRMLDIAQPVRVDDIYINVNVLEELPSNKRNLEFSEVLRFNSHVDDFNRLSLGKVSQSDIPGLEAATRYSKLMVLGKPGAGKTTFLKFLAIQCNHGNFQPKCIPIFIELKVFARNVNDEYNFSLLRYITEQLCIYGISSQQIEKLLYQGKFLILLDGLDEVKDTNAYEVQSQINDFIGNFCKNNFVITCRVAAHQYKFQGFTDIEITDFNEEQIAQFVNKWFVAVAGKPPEKTLAKSKELLEELYWEGNEPILELAVTPILLNLICLVFHGTGSLPSQRSKLYEEGLEILLKQWDRTKGVKRDDIYHKLSISDKKQLLRYLAFITFIKNDYFFEKSQIQQYIVNCIPILVNHKINLYELQELSDAVLQLIIIQHGLLVERAKGIYSFSHLTFQEYFTAQIISEISEPDILKNLAIHVIEKRWREVFLLVSELRWNAGILIYYMKQTIDSLLASDEKLQFFLKWLKEKSISSKVSYKLNSIRAFYFTLIRTNANRIMHYDPELLELSIALDDTFEYALDYEYKIIEADNYELDNDINFPSELVIDKDLVFAIEFDSDFSRSVNLSLDTSSDFSDEIRRLHNLMCKMLVSNLPLSLYRAFKLTCALNINPELAQSLVELLNQLPHHQPTDENKQIFVEWWKVNNQIWNEKLRGAIAKYRNIGHNWQFSEHQNKLIEEYYNANKLLVNCLNNGCYVSPKVRSQIEDELFLPWDEVQQGKLQE